MAKANNVIDIDFSPIQRTKIRISGDESKILELNLSDTRFVSRYPKAFKYMDEITLKAKELIDTVNIPKNFEDFDEDTMNQLSEFTAKLDELDAEMRDCIDSLFDANVCAVCVDGGSMFDVIDGKFRYEAIVEILFSLYDGTITEETKKMEKRVKKHTSKYEAKK